MSSLSINCILIIRREKLFGSRREGGMISAPSFVQFGEIPADLSPFLFGFYLLFGELTPLMISKTNYQIHENHNCSHGNRLKACGDHESRLQMWVEDIEIYRMRELQQHGVPRECF